MTQAIANNTIKKHSSGTVWDIRYFLYYIKGISEKTRHNYMSCLRDFFRNLVDDEIIEVTQAPRMPKVPYDLGYRKITDTETQNALLNEVKELTYHLILRSRSGVICFPCI